MSTNKYPISYLSEALQAWERHIATEKAKFIDDYIAKKQAKHHMLFLCARCNKAWTPRDWCARCELEDDMV